MTLIFAIDLAAYVGIMALILRQRPFAELLRTLAPTRRLLLMALVLAVPVGQVIHRSELTYPWVAWVMYTDRLPGDVTYLEYTLVLADGSEVELAVARQFSRIGKKVVWRLKGLESAGSLTTCDRILTKLGHRFNDEHQGNPAVSIRIWDCVVPMATDSGTHTPQRTPRRSVNL